MWANGSLLAMVRSVNHGHKEKQAQGEAMLLLTSKETELRKNGLHYHIDDLWLIFTMVEQAFMGC